MSTPASEVAALRGIADELMEARRYVRSKPDHAKAMAKRAMNDIHGSLSGASFTPYVAIPWARIVANLDDGLAAIRHDPLVLEGHLYAAARLLQSIARRLEGEAKSDD